MQTCNNQFNGWAEEAYNKVIEKNKQLESFERINYKLKDELEQLREDHDKLSKDILLSETEWEFLIKIQVRYSTIFSKLTHELNYFDFCPLQNYYYLLMDIEWRNEHDWIHRNSKNCLLTPLEGIKFCGERNIRPKTVCSADAVKEYFISEIKPNFDKINAIQPDTNQLKNVKFTLDIYLDIAFMYKFL